MEAFEVVGVSAGESAPACLVTGFAERESAVCFRTEVLCGRFMGFGESRILSSAAARYESAVRIVGGERSADAKNTFSLLQINIEAGDRVLLEAWGADACACVRALAGLVLSGFGIAEVGRGDIKKDIGSAEEGVENEHN